MWIKPNLYFVRTISRLHSESSDRGGTGLLIAPWWIQTDWMRWRWLLMAESVIHVFWPTSLWLCDIYSHFQTGTQVAAPQTDFQLDSTSTWQTAQSAEKAITTFIHISSNKANRCCLHISRWVMITVFDSHRDHNWTIITILAPCDTAADSKWNSWKVLTCRMSALI